MAGFDFMDNLFQGSEQMRGLSGAKGSNVALDDANSFYNFRLRRHGTASDLAASPEHLWKTHGDDGHPAGVAVHAGEALAQGRRFTDVLVVLSGADWSRLEAADGDVPAAVADVLRPCWTALFEEHGLTPPRRPVGAWVVRDGSPEIGGTDFGLEAGQFITGMVPNLYRAPGARSQPVIGLHINIPGAWEGYREVGRLYDDQVLFTVGNHWLDNFAHPQLREAALYRLQRDDEGGFFHIVNPDLQDRYYVVSTDQQGTSVITIATREGEPVAYVVLAVLDETGDDAGSVNPQEAPDDALAAQQPEEPAAPEPELEISLEHVEDLGPALDLPAEPVASPAAEAADVPALTPIDLPATPRKRQRSRTIVPEAHGERIFTLQERGALLQKVHFGRFMLGYDVYLGSRGELGTVVDDKAATFQVRRRSVSLLANADNLHVDGEHLPAGESMLVEGDVILQLGNQRLEYRDLRGVTADGWPYVGEIRRPASSTYMLWGQGYAIGRSRDSRVVLPDEPRNDNIVWKPSVGDGATIKSKTGEIPKSRFYTDSIMVSSQHAAIELIEETPVLSCRARSCYTFVRRRGEVVPLYPTSDKEHEHRAELEPGDEVLIGNCVFHVGFTPRDEPGAPGLAPAPRVSSDSLVDAVDDPILSAEDPPASFGALDGDSAFGNLPDFVDSEDAPPPPRIDPSAEASLRHERAEPRVRPVSASMPPPLPVVTGSDEEEETLSAPVAQSGPLGASAVEAVGAVVVVDDEDAQFELGRPARLVQEGWALNGRFTCGNHADADLVVPENRVDPSQRFAPVDYFSVRVRGRKARLEAVDADEVRIDGGAPASAYDDASDVVISIVRRDEDGEEDFTVDLRLVEDAALPDPRARLLALDRDEPLAAALMTRGFPKAQPRTLSLAGLTFTGTFVEGRLVVSDHLASYRRGDGFLPVFVQLDGGRFQTIPEDGSPVQLQPGDRLVIDGAVFRFEVP